jgi:hypothetical protein
MDTTYTVRRWNCSSFSYATSSSLFMLTAGPRDQFLRWRRSRRRLSVCSVLKCSDLWLQCSLSCVHGLKKTLFLCGASFLNRTRNSRCTITTDLDTSKRSTQKDFSCCDAILETGPAAPHMQERRTAGSACETRALPAADIICYARAGWEINFYQLLKPLHSFVHALISKRDK